MSTKAVPKRSGVGVNPWRPALRWQVLGSSRVPVRDMVRLDYQYVADWSLWNDIRILLLTIPQIVRGRAL
jgi:lipopolysaccharide/colanic/teichoic acid biosynthesis glycosyltransferase